MGEGSGGMWTEGDSFFIWGGAMIDRDIERLAENAIVFAYSFIVLNKL